MLARCSSIVAEPTQLPCIRRHPWLLELVVKCETASVAGINARISSLVNPNGKRSHQQAAARPHSAKCSPRDVSERRCFSFSSTRQQLTPLSEGSGGASGHEEASVDSARGALPSPQRSAQDEDALTGGQESKAASPIATDTAKFAAPWIFEAKPGGWLHMREHKRIFALTSPATAAPTAKGDAHSEAAAAENSNLSSFSECSSSVEGIPMIQFRSAAIRGGQQRCGVGTLIQKQCIQAIAAFGSTVERSWVYRHLTYPEADWGGTQLGRIFKRAEMRSYLRFLAARLPCLELQTLLEAFLSTGLSDMDEQQMKELLTLLHLGERQAAGDVVVVTSSSAKNRKVEVGGAASHCTCDLRHCCMPERKSSRNSKGDSDSNNKSSTGDDSRDCCCDSLTADFLLRLLKGGSIPPACVPPCLRAYWKSRAAERDREVGCSVGVVSRARNREAGVVAGSLVRLPDDIVFLTPQCKSRRLNIPRSKSLAKLRPLAQPGCIQCVSSLQLLFEL
ncbi:hypothetical protein cyc_07602 [Cyclospora cayetanensis]|uniref:Uncharacterized protein n=1 Tax=Cyclospora cayetanensis TaxID=88456 RepID=A0A1D3DA42_9EIME|nr:hypothetical protein cyc_07602 [Cyclospora cayetanensis]